MKPPAGFHQTLYPLRHRLMYSCGLSTVSATQNSTLLTLVKNYKTVVAPELVVVNPSNPAFEVDEGAICSPMSIIDRLKMHLSFDLTNDATLTDLVHHLKLTWMPIFFSFPEKLDAADDKTTTTVKAILELTSDATEEDVTPLWSNVDLDTTGPAEKNHPVSTANLAEVFGLMNLTTNTAMESVAFNSGEFYKALRYYTNKGALKACIGKTRTVHLSPERRHTSFHIDKFVPRSIRRIVPYSFFGILIHCPLNTEVDQAFSTVAGTAGLTDVGINLIATYDEWNVGFRQEMAGDGT